MSNRELLLSHILSRHSLSSAMRSFHGIGMGGRVLVSAVNFLFFIFFKKS
jgi:hypothetical protein